MKKVLAIMLLSCSAYAQDAAVVHINAEFNASNDWYGLDILENTKLYGGSIDKQPALKEKYSITKVPTLILFSNGVEVKRWEAGLDMKLHVTAKEVQHAIDAL